MNPSFGSESSPSVDHLRAGEFPARLEDVTLDAGNLQAGAVLGKITLGAIASAAKAGGNTGNGTLTLDAVTPILAGASAGVYRVRVIVAAAEGVDLVARVEDPNGVVRGDMGDGDTFADQIKFVLDDGDGPAFAVGDGFDVTIAAGSLHYKLSVVAALDGSQVAHRILAKAVDASGGAKNAPVYCTGEFAKNKLSFGAGHTADTVKDALEAQNIYLADTRGF